jgi:hypothetical protein
VEGEEGREGMKTLQKLREEVQITKDESTRTCMIWMLKKKIADSAKKEQQVAKKISDAAAQAWFKAEDELYARCGEREKV